MLVVLATLVVTAGVAAGQQTDDERAKEAYELGYAALQAGDYAKALEHYQRSYAITPRPRTLFNIAVAEERLGRLAEAIRHYTEFVEAAEERDEAFKTEALQKIEALEKRRASKTGDAKSRGDSAANPEAPAPSPEHSPPTSPAPSSLGESAPSDAGTLRVAANLGGAAVTIDGSVVGATAGGGPLVRALAAGHHEVAVDRSGSGSWSRRLHLSPGETVSVDVEFRDGDAALRWGLTGLGVAAVGAGATFGVLALRDVASGGAERNDRGKSRALVSDLLVAGGAVALWGAWRLWKRAGTRATVRRDHPGAGR